MEHDVLRKELLGALIGLAKTCSNNPKTENTDRILIEGLVTVHTEAFGEEMLRKKLEMVRQEKHTIAPNCSTCASPCGNTSDYELDLLKEDECADLKQKMLHAIQETGIDFYQAILQGIDVSAHMEIFYKVLEVVTYHMEEEILKKILKEILDVKPVVNKK